MKLEFSGQIHEKVSNIKFFQNPCSGNRDVPRGDRWTGAVALIVIHDTDPTGNTFHNNFDLLF
jgi:hypothetical protein